MDARKIEPQPLVDTLPSEDGGMATKENAMLLSTGKENGQ